MMLSDKQSSTMVSHFSATVTASPSLIAEIAKTALGAWCETCD